MGQSQPYDPTPKQREYLNNERDAGDCLVGVIEDMTDDELWYRLGEVHSYLNRTGYLDQFSLEFHLLNEELSLRKDPDYPIVDFQIRAMGPANTTNENCMFEDCGDEQVEKLTANIAAMSENELWSRRDQLDCDIDRYGYMEGAGFELNLIEDELATRRTSA